MWYVSFFLVIIFFQIAFHIRTSRTCRIQVKSINVQDQFIFYISTLVWKQSSWNTSIKTISLLQETFPPTHTNRDSGYRCLGRVVLHLLLSKRQIWNQLLVVTFCSEHQVYLHLLSWFEYSCRTACQTIHLRVGT